MKVCVNSEKCIGCGNCVAITEGQVFDFNDEGLANSVVEEVPADFVEQAKDAIEECPTGAISEEK